jgi:neutral ceramidase
MFAVHPTAMSHESPLFGADLVGHAMARLEERSGHPDFVAGFFNGAQGDISPDWIAQDRQDVLRLGDRLADAVTLVTSDQGVPVRAPRLRYAMREFARDWRDPTPGGPRLASRPLVGAATMGGAEDARTPFHALGWRAGVVSTREGCATAEQGCKKPALGRPLRTALRNLDRPAAGAIAEWLDLTSWLGPPSAFPSVLPVSVIRFGDVLTLASVPVEVTTAMAWRIRESLGLSHRFVLVGLANDYFSYTTTPEEYEAQAYEGASTLLGPKQGPAIEAMIKYTAADLSVGPPASERVPARSFHVGRYRSVPFGPDLLEPARPMIDEGLMPLWPEHLMFREGASPRFSWTESHAEDWSTERRVRVLDEATHAEVEGAWTTNLLTMIAASCPRDRSADQPDDRPCDRRWTVLWLPSPSTTMGRYYFEVHTGDVRTGNRRRFCSPVFSLAVSGVVPVPDVGLPTTCPITAPEARK